MKMKNSQIYWVIILIILGVDVKQVVPIIFSSIYKLYLEQGIPFRENTFLGNRPILKEYDFVVVGSGPGGSVVASRLSEIPQWKVLVLEAGEAETIYTDIPATCGNWQLSDYNWGYRAERTGNSCLAMVDERCPWPRGKGVGGTSIINYMIYTRGHRKDYDNYAKAGNYGWSYNEILPYFLKSENSSIYLNSSYHSQKGNLHVERVRYKTPLVDAFVKAGEELGYDNVDYTEPEAKGFSRIQATTINGHRMSAAKAYLVPAKDRPNLHVAINSRVTKILIDPSTKRAYGVEFTKNRQKRIVFARKEIILSAGALNSPQLLMLSGVGPKDHLNELDIPVIQDLPVGMNLQEHYATVGLSFLVNETGISVTEKRITMRTAIDWLKNGNGVLTVPGGVEGIAYINTKYNRKSYPDMEFIFVGASLASDNGRIVRKTFGVSDSKYNELFGNIANMDTWTIFPMLLHPKSKGCIKLQSKNPWQPPKFYYNYFQDERDLKTLVEGVKEVIKLSKTKSFQKYGSKLNPSTISECNNHEFNSDAYWSCFVRYFTGTLHHQCGTCKMGPSSDKTAVVDPELKVHGVSRLRVVDSSIFPKIPGAHLYAPTIMVGEKASDMIKAAWNTNNNIIQDAIVKDCPTSSEYPNIIINP